MTIMVPRAPDEVDGHEGGGGESVELGEEWGQPPLLHQAPGGVLHQHVPWKQLLIIVIHV